jgi:ATP-binding cassette subfamily C protein LapB
MKFYNDYKKINRIPLKYIPIIIMSVLTMNILGLAIPLTMKQIYGRVLIDKSKEALIIIIIICGIAIILETLVKRSKELITKWIAAKHEYFLTLFSIKKKINSSTSNIENYNGDLEKFNAIKKVANFYSENIYKLLVDLPFLQLLLLL